MEFVETKFLVWMALISRLTGFFLVAPFFSGAMFPVEVKVSLLVFLSWLLTVSSGTTIPLNSPIFLLVVNSILNFLVGFGIGYLPQLVLQAFGGAGYIVGFQMGLGIEEVFALSDEEGTNPMGEIVYFLALSVFVILKGPLLIYEGLVDSLKVFPADLLSLKTSFLEHIVHSSGDFFVMVLKIGLPMMAFMLIVSVVLGILSRLVPQMNVFMVGLPLKVLVGLIFFMGMIPIWAEVAGEISGRALNAISSLIGE